MDTQKPTIVVEQKDGNYKAWFLNKPSVQGVGNSKREAIGDMVVKLEVATFLDWCGFVGVYHKASESLHILK